MVKADRDGHFSTCLFLVVQLDRYGRAGQCHVSISGLSLCVRLPLSGSYSLDPPKATNVIEAKFYDIVDDEGDLVPSPDKHLPAFRLDRQRTGWPPAAPLPCEMAKRCWESGRRVHHLESCLDKHSCVSTGSGRPKNVTVRSSARSNMLEAHSSVLGEHRLHINCHLFYFKGVSPPVFPLTE